LKFYIDGAINSAGLRFGSRPGRLGFEIWSTLLLAGSSPREKAKGTGLTGVGLMLLEIATGDDMGVWWYWAWAPVVCWVTAELLG